MSEKEIVYEIGREILISYTVIKSDQNEMVSIAPNLCEDARRGCWEAASLRERSVHVGGVAREGSGQMGGREVYARVARRRGEA